MKPITIELTEPVLKAINTAFSELFNHGDWARYYTEDEVETIYQAMMQFKNINETLIKK
jgi:hypothetical protein